eukprot:PhM_4_TR9751/c2_g1_i1/m.80839
MPEAERAAPPRRRLRWLPDLRRVRAPRDARAGTERHEKGHGGVHAPRPTAVRGAQNSNNDEQQQQQQQKQEQERDNVLCCNHLEDIAVLRHELRCARRHNHQLLDEIDRLNTVLHQPKTAAVSVSSSASLSPLPLRSVSTTSRSPPERQRPVYGAAGARTEAVTTTTIATHPPPTSRNRNNAGRSNNNNNNNNIDSLLRWSEELLS